MLSFIGGFVLDIFVFICGVRIVKMAFRWTKTALNTMSDKVDDKIKNLVKEEPKKKMPVYSSTGERTYVEVEAKVE